MKFDRIRNEGHRWDQVRTFSGDHSEIWINGLDLNLRRVCDLVGVEIKGIVQVGANLGQELGEFPDDVPLLLLEPHPEIFPKLAKKIQDMPNVSALNVAAGDEQGNVDFFLTQYHQQSSLRQLNLGKSEGIRRVSVEMTTLDTLLADDRRSGLYNVLLIDTQGAEDVVLKGAESVLNSFDVVIMEMSYGLELYHDNADGYELEQVMSEAGFQMVAVDPLEWMPCLLKDGAGYWPTRVSRLRYFPRLFLFKLAQLADNVRDEFPFKARAFSLLADCFSWNSRDVAAQDLQAYLDRVESLGYQYAQRHTNAAFVRRDLLQG